jgi:Kef-type K+ transport system membrane component KefB
MMNTALFGFLTLVALGMALVFTAIAAVYVKRLQDRVPHPLGDEVGSAKAVTRKVRKREPMSHDELDYANQLVAARSSLMTFCIPGALFSAGCFYVFGSLYHLHGATPSERTFLGVFPMLASVNFTTQILRSRRLKRRLKTMS